MSPKSPPPPPPPPPAPRRNPGYKIRPDLDDAVRGYQQTTGAQRNAIFDQALEEYLAARGLWSPDQRE
jgi:hypothetical protein